MKVPVFVWQFDNDYRDALLGGDDRQLPFSEVWVKTHDGQVAQGHFDTHATRVNTAQDVPRVAEVYAGQGITLRTWMVPHGRETWDTNAAAAEGSLTARMLSPTAGGVALVDLEPHEPAPDGDGAYYWRDDLGANGEDVGLFISAFLAGGGKELWLVPDARPGRIPSAESWFASHAVTRVMPQVYWTTFQQGWKPALDAAYIMLVGYGLPAEMIYPVLPGDAEPNDMVAAIVYCKALGFGGVSIWRRGNLREDTAAAIAALADPWARVWETPPARPVPAGELALARSEIRQAQSHLQSALEALDTLGGA